MFEMNHESSRRNLYYEAQKNFPLLLAEEHMFSTAFQFKKEKKIMAINSGLET